MSLGQSKTPVTDRPVWLVLTAVFAATAAVQVYLALAMSVWLSGVLAIVLAFAAAGSLAAAAKAVPITRRSRP
ncbi:MULTISPECIES: hypothetical protein [Amycolatopsis]|uniref:Uncharacterized protein n=2 Tax=Amycolatopsis methanolica group TaxID=2893674 RepID=A0A076N5Q5_AMYME|nr:MULTISPECIES: hypothetical protein [Amycolatopsis methanolica group]AIJ25312.1 hypothetical protein AMETH_5220 [Amycolatopsis methanolica 239]ROS42780.1 hypothetical protein EDD35_5179 [Amycolatopsis thermoflava]